MAKLKQVIGAILSDITKGQVISDAYSRDLKSSYREDPVLKLLSVPRTEIKDVTINLKFAILKGENNTISNDTLPKSKVVIYQDADYQGASQELIEGSYDIADLKIYEQANGTLYQVENQWGGSSAPWHEGGRWLIGSRSNQNVVAIEVKSSDGGQTLNGTMTYAGEGPIGFRATISDGNNYTVENQWGGDSAPWNPGGQWIIGGRSDQRVVALQLNSSDGGKTLNGTMTYNGEGPIGFRGTVVENNEKLSSFNDQLSSLKVPNGMKVTLYEHAGFSGRSKSFNEDTPWVGDDFNDITSSIKVEQILETKQILPVDIDTLEVEVVTDYLTTLPEAAISSMSIKLDMTSV